MKVAALDLGTNSFLCLIAEVQNGEIQKIYSDQVQIVRLGQDVNKTKKFHPEAIQRAKSCLENFKKSIDQQKPEKILAMATSAARDVTNSDELFRIGEALNIPIEIIPGNREAEISFRGSVSGFPQDDRRRAVVDIGGGSTEIIAGDSHQILGGYSVDIGALRLTEMFFPSQPPTKQQIQHLKEFASEKLKLLCQTIKALSVHEIIAVAGTPTELAAATLGGFDAQKIDGHKFTRAALQDWVHKFETSTSDERVTKYGISRGRADTIMAGTLILELILEQLSVPDLTVSTRGVRYGVALELEKRG